MDENAIGKQVVDAAIRVHRELGPGLLETVYEVALARELELRGLKVERQVPVPIVYRGLRFEEGFRADIIVENKVILELKAVELLSKVHAKQLFTYLKLKGLRLGFILNFGATLMKDGIERVVNGLPEPNLGVFASWRESKSEQSESHAKMPIATSKAQGRGKPQGGNLPTELSGCDPTRERLAIPRKRVLRRRQ